MKTFDYILKSFMNAGGVCIYVSGIAWLGFNTQGIDNVAGFALPVFMLLLFVVSASITGGLVLGKPILLYLEGMKREALILFFTTLGWLIVFLVVIASTLFYSQATHNETDQKKIDVFDNATTTVEKTNDSPAVDSNNNTKSLPPPEIPKVVKQCVPAGCSSVVCVDATKASEIVTACEYEPWYACYKSAQCEVQTDGECGWTQTPELTACRANSPIR
ncbi:hypothetical protein IPJ70_00535 [Candidatus Campbellbacteria bacterium]|nr:MAG: hypothetical protein IPJ70_00535 [Candidatus Campbellbacteria bacterium]